MEHKITIEQAKAYIEMYGRMFESQGTKHWNPYAFFLANLREYKVAPGFRQMTPKHCFTNAAIQSVGADYDYIDGYVSVCGLLIRHAWNEMDGEAFDFTIRDDCAERGYFGVRFPAEVVEEITDSKYWVIADGLVGTLAMMPEEQRNRLLEAAGYNPNGGAK